MRRRQLTGALGSLATAGAPLAAAFTRGGRYALAATHGQILSTDFAHRVEIRADPAELAVLDLDRSVRVPCDVRIDGEEYSGAQIAEKGSLGSAATLDGKPSFNVWFRGVKPGGLDKLTLNNCRQDVSLLHEHLAYDLYRRAGLFAPRTTHGTVTLNDRPYGVYLLVEPVDDEFLVRTFGRGNGRGNLYEGTARGDFLDGVADPTVLELKDEDEGRSRQDLAALVAAAGAADADLEARVSERLDFERFLMTYALDSLLAHWDGPFFNHNNYYLYDNPADGRFVFVAHGMDQVFDAEWDAFTPPVSRLAQRVRAIPALEARWRAAMDTLIETVWDVDALLARMDQVASILAALIAGGAADDVAAADVWVFEQTVDGMRDQVRWRHDQWVPGSPA